MNKPIYLYVTPFFPSAKTWQGGFCLDAVKALRADGRYDVIVMTGEDYGGDYEIDGVKVYQFPRVKLGAWEYLEYFFIRAKNRLFLKKLREIDICPNRIAVCHVHDYYHYIPYALAIKKLNPKCLTLVHHHFAGYYSLRIGSIGIVPIWSDLLYLKIKREFEKVDAHVFISEHCRRCYGRSVDFDTGEDRGPLRLELPWGRFYADIRHKDSYVLYNGVDRDVFNKQGNQPRRFNGELKIGCVANFHPCKRQIDLIKAIEIVMKHIPNVQLLLVGDSGAEYGLCREYVDAHRLNRVVSFIKPMRHSLLPDFYRSIDLFVMPSVNEGFCCVNVEALACGTPFIAVEGLPMEEVLAPANKSLWLVPPRDVEKLASRILDFSANRESQVLSRDLDSRALAREFLDWIAGKQDGKRVSK